MKTLKTLFAAAFIASVSLAGTAQADNSLSSLIYEQSANIYTDVSYEKSTPASIRSYGDDRNQNSVWSFEYEQYVNPADFSRPDYADINEYMQSNPTAAGAGNDDVFKWNELAGEYQLN